MSISKDDNYYQKNKEKIIDYGKKYYQENKDKVKEAHKKNYRVTKDARRNNKLKHLYNLTREDYNYMLEQQDNCCACCGEPFLRTPHVDHCHDTNVVRALLCSGCNTGLGSYEKKRYLFEQYLSIYGKGVFFDKS